MRLARSNGIVIVTLSEHNLLALLVKLYIPGSYRTLVKDENDGSRLLVKSETDKEATEINGYPPGRLSEETEALITKLKAAVREVVERNPVKSMNRFYAVPNPDGRGGFLVAIPGTSLVNFVPRSLKGSVRVWGTVDQLHDLVQQGVYKEITSQEATDLVEGKK